MAVIARRSIILHPNRFCRVGLSFPNGCVSAAPYSISALFVIPSLILMIIFLPETEGCTLDDIETHFSDNNRRLRDIKIRKSNPIRENGGQQQAANAEYALDASDNNEMRVTSGSAVLEMVTSANQRTTSKGRDNCGYDDEEL